MNRYLVTVDGRTYEVEVDDPRARPVTARVLGEVFRVDVGSGVRRPEGQAPPPAGSPAAAPGLPALPASDRRDQWLRAPIPGTIAKLVATVGQTVQRGDELVTIEAMKMFNVIRSPWAGTVTAIHVTEGKHVMQGEPLMSFLLS